MAEDQESIWRGDTASAPLHFYDATRKRIRSGDKSELWKRYHHRANTIAGSILLPVLSGVNKKDQLKAFKKELSQKAKEDPEFVPLLKELLPEGFDWEK